MAQLKINKAFMSEKPIIAKGKGKGKDTVTSAAIAAWVPPVQQTRQQEFDLCDLLAAQFKEKEKARQEEKLRLEQEASNSFVEDTIERSRKDNVFLDEISEQDKDIIQKRVLLQQQQFEARERLVKQRNLAAVRSVYEHVSQDEIELTLSQCENDPDEAVAKFAEPDHLVNLRRLIAESHSQVTHMSDAQHAAYNRLLAKRTTVSKKTASNVDKQKMYNRNCGRLALDDALKQLQSGDAEKAMEGWSSARIRAYGLVKTNPNAYYYRFNAPGEAQRNGSFTKAEHELFLRRLEEVKREGNEGHWGIFAMAIPGRVGYQCSNYYRSLLVKGILKDDKYYINDKGKAIYLFGTKKDAEGNPIDKDEDGVPAKRSRSSNGGGGSKKRGRKRTEEDDDDDDMDFDMDTDQMSESQSRYKSNAWKTTKRTRALRGEVVDETEEETQANNPLPNHIDPITLDIVVKPAISPYGHVASLASWLQWLSEHNTCPLTKKPLKKSDLVVLTHQNIDRYRDKIMAVP